MPTSIRSRASEGGNVLKQADILAFRRQELRAAMYEYMTDRKQLYTVKPKKGATIGNSALSISERDLARAFEKVEFLLSQDAETLSE